jgi:DNA primase
MDCITLHQYGINNVVASLGTALTVNQAKLLKRFADNIIISYDADMAGQNATERGLKILVDVGLLVKVLKVPEGKDPDEYIRKNGKSSFEELVANALPLIEYKINKAKEGINLKNKDEQLKYIKSVSDILVDSDSVEKNIYIKKVSEETGLSEQSIYDYINDELKKIAPAYEEVNNIDNIGQKLYLDPAFLKAERLLLKFMFEEKELYEYIVSRIDEDQFNLPSHTKIFKLIAENNELDLESKKKVLDLKCDDVESSSEWISICEEEFVNNNCDIKVLINDYITNIKKFKLEETKKYIMKNIKLYEQKGMFEESLKMVKRLNEIQMEISNLN